MLNNTSLIILLDKELLNNHISKQSSEININTQRLRNKLNYSQNEKKNQTENDVKVFFKVNLIIGFKFHRKAVIKYILQLNSEFSSIILKLAKLNSDNDYNVTNFLSNSEQKLFIKLKLILSGLPQGIQLLGLMIQVPEHIEKYENDVDSIINISPKLLHELFSVFNLSEFNLIILNSESICIKSSSSLVGEKLEFLCKEGILERNVVLKVKLNPLISVSRIFYDEFENLDPKKRQYFQYLLNSIVTTIQSSTIKYDFIYSLISETKKVEINENTNKEVVDIVEEDISFPADIYLSNLKNLRNKSKLIKENKENSLDLLALVNEVEKNLNETLENSKEEIIGDSKGENEENSKNLAFSYRLKHLNLDFLMDLTRIDFENSMNKLNANNTSFSIKLESLIPITLYCKLDLTIKEFEATIKEGLVNYLTENLVSKLDSAKIYDDNYERLNVVVEKHKIFLLGDEIEITFNQNEDSKISKEDFENVFAFETVTLI